MEQEKNTRDNRAFLNVKYVYFFWKICITYAVCFATIALISYRFLY